MSEEKLDEHLQIVKNLLEGIVTDLLEGDIIAVLGHRCCLDALASWLNWNTRSEPTQATGFQARDSAVDISDTSRERTPTQADFPPMKDPPKSDGYFEQPSISKKAEIPEVLILDVPKKQKQRAGNVQDYLDTTDPPRGEETPT